MTARPERPLLVLVAVVVAFDLWRYSGDVIDDTYISLRYALNWVDGHGLVFNPGERVEGYTNFLFVAASAAFLRLGIDPVAGTKALSLAFALATLVAMARIERRGPGLARGGLPASVLLLLPLEAFVYWSMASFETMLFTGLLTLALARLLAEGAAERGHLSAALFVLLALTRPEGAFLFGVCTGAAFAVESVAARAFVQLRRHAVNVLLFAGCIAPFFLWRRAYYGRFLPNTFYAKVTGGWAEALNGAAYLGQFALACPVVVLAFVVPLFILLARRQRLGERAVPFAIVYLVALGHVAYVVAVGGDFMPFFRFLVPILPLGCLLVAWTFGVLAEEWPRREPALRLGFAAAVLAGMFASHATEQPYRAFVAHRTAEVGERVGKWLATELRPEDFIAVNTAGAVPYFSRLPSIDTLGLTDAAIANRPVFIVSTGWAGHRKGWGDYVLGRRPRVILWYNSAGSREPFYLGDHELAESPFFRFFYRAKAVTLETNGGAARRVLERFSGDPFEVGHPGSAFSPDLGLEAELHDFALPYTVLRDAPVTVTYFELDERDLNLWRPPRPAELDSLLAQAVQTWRAVPRRPEPDRARTAEVEALCDQARREAQDGDYPGARRTLTAAARLNADVRSPLVYQYIANVAVMSGDLLVAVGAQKEALRLAPENELYRTNLKSLLTMPFDKGHKSRRERRESALER